MATIVCFPFAPLLAAGSHCSLARAALSVCQPRLRQLACLPSCNAITGRCDVSGDVAGQYALLPSAASFNVNCAPAFLDE